MNSFTKKKVISHQTIPETLRRTREEQALSLVEVSKTLNIQINYLQALEDGAYELIPGQIYAQQWLKAYGNLLDLDIKWLLREYDREKGVQMHFTGFDRPNIKVKKYWLSWITPKLLRIVGISILAVGFFSYLGSGVYNIIKPPTLTIFEPQNNITTELRTINISGQTDPEIELSINNELILADNSGAFKKSINLSPGLNILKVKATKKHGSIKEITISVFRKEAQVNINNTSLFNQTNF